MILAVLQARMSSTRLPGKVMADVCGRPMILRQIERVARERHIDRLVVATSDDPSDDSLAALLEAEGVLVHRGTLQDVLGRFVSALSAFGPAEHVVRLTADCPLADPSVLETVIDRHLTDGSDYAASTLPRRTFPIGLDVEICRADALRQAEAEATEPYEREHVTPFLYRRPDRFRLAGVTQAAEEGDVRWTVDRADDLEFVRRVYAALYPHDDAFDSEAVRALVRSRPELQTWGGDRRV